jgi:uncharacterized protein YndB with AHSA1/START domain
MAAANKPSTVPTVRITLPSDREFTMTRVFDAPRALVFEAMTRPELIKRWFGPPPECGWTIAVCEGEPRVGGTWRVEMHKPDGARIVLHGAYREFTPPDRFVATQMMEGCEGQGSNEAVATMVFVERNGKTTFTNTVSYPSKDVRDNALKYGTSEESMSAVYDKLATLLESLA